MTTFYTPGPWLVEPTSNANNGSEWRDIVGGRGPYAPLYIGEARAHDAALIAAAPKLYETLVDLVAILNSPLTSVSTRHECGRQYEYALRDAQAALDGVRAALALNYDDKTETVEG